MRPEAGVGPEQSQDRRVAGTALEFDGSNDVLAIHDADVLDLIEPFTIRLWTCCDGIGPGSPRHDLPCKERWNGPGDSDGGVHGTRSEIAR